ncbi:MAG: hypothetical protein SWH61_12980 [Thermodesulfobacteriota bacterium]|nr:hypothetical protein [Thermodesulfobacteriota bacterium]
MNTILKEQAESIQRLERRVQFLEDSWAVFNQIDKIVALNTGGGAYEFEVIKGVLLSAFECTPHEDRQKFAENLAAIVKEKGEGAAQETAQLLKHYCSKMDEDGVEGQHDHSAAQPTAEG